VKRLILILTAVVTAGVAFADSDTLLRVGDTAPDFSLPYATRDSVASNPLQLSSLVGKRNIVLAFYPADWSGGCTKEVCTLRDNFSMLGAVNADVIAISGDYIFSHYEWAKFHNLPFRLASDHDHAVAKKYGTYDAPSGYNHRTVFVIDRQGKLGYIDLKYSPRDSVSFEKLQLALKGMK
jgi:peroxiredoxin